MNMNLVCAVATAELPNATASMRRVLCILATAADLHGVVTLTVTTMCSDHSLSVGTARRAIKRMTEAGWLVSLGMTYSDDNMCAQTRRIDVQAFTVPIKKRLKTSPFPTSADQ